MTGHHGQEAGGLPERSAIDRLQEICVRLGRTDLLGDLAEIADRLREGRLSVALIGQFKRGKTSLLNALLQDAVLPTGVLPLTAMVTHVRWGPAVRATVRFLDGSEREVEREAIADFVTEVRNPRNVRGVRDVQLTHPADVLQAGIELVDTPGIGSVWEHNTHVATDYLPWVDVALFVVSPDPPITVGEREFLRLAREHSGKILLVLAKSDLLDDVERAQVSAFIQEVAEETLGKRVPLLCTSVGSAAQSSTGVRDLQERLREIAGSEGASMPAAMASRRLSAVTGRLRFDLGIRRAAVATPLALRGERFDALQGGIGALPGLVSTYRAAWEQSLRQLDASLDERLALRAEALREQLREDRVRRLAAAKGHPRTAYADILEAGTALAQAGFLALRDELRLAAREILAATAEPLVDQIRRQADAAARAAAEVFQLPAIAIALPLHISESRGFSFKWQEDPSMLPALRVPAGVIVLPRTSALAAADRAIGRHLDAFVDRNLGRLRYHFRESMHAEWQQMGRRIEETLGTLLRSLTDAADALRADDPQTQESLRELDATIAEIAAVEAAI